MLCVAALHAGPVARGPCRRQALIRAVPDQRARNELKRAIDLSVLLVCARCGPCRRACSSASRPSRRTINDLVTAFRRAGTGGGTAWTPSHPSRAVVAEVALALISLLSRVLLIRWGLQPHSVSMRAIRSVAPGDVLDDAAEPYDPDLRAPAYHAFSISCGCSVAGPPSCRVCRRRSPQQSLPVARTTPPPTAAPV